MFWIWSEKSVIWFSLRFFVVGIILLIFHFLKTNFFQSVPLSFFFGFILFQFFLHHYMCIKKLEIIAF